MRNLVKNARERGYYITVEQANKMFDVVFSVDDINLVYQKPAIMNVILNKFTEFSSNTGFNSDNYWSDVQKMREQSVGHA
jgi:hypothetical protein